MENGAHWIDRDIEKIQKIIDEGGQATATALKAGFDGSETGYQIGGEDVAAADAFVEEIVNGFNDRLPSESYRMMVEYGQKLKAVYESRVKAAQERIDKLVAGEDAAEKPASEES